MSKNKNKQRGFTFVEMLVSVSLVAVVIVSATQLFTRILRVNRKARAIIQTKQTGDQALRIMADKIRNASQITSTCEAGGSSSNSLDFQHQDGEATVNYSLECDSGLILTQDSEPKNLIGADVTLDCGTALFNCTASQFGPQIVAISFSLSKDDNPALNFSTTVSLRNY